MNSLFKNISITEKLKRLFKYLVNTILVILLLRYYPKYKFPQNEIIVLALMITIIFALLDMFSPTIHIN